LQGLLAEVEGGVAGRETFINNRLHKLSIPEGRKPIIWVHLHNFAGTFICEEAQAQGERIPMPLIENCNVREGGEVCSQQSGRHLCKNRAQSGYSLTMIERDLEDDDFCDEALMGVIMRDPVAACLSTIRANLFDKEALLKMLADGQVTAYNRSADHDSGCLPNWDTYQHFDNFATRSLGGGYMAKLGQVTREHLSVAKKRLQRMDVLMILEELRQHMRQLPTVFGWDVSAASSGQKKNSHDSDKYDEVVFTEEEETFLREINKLDYELYSFARDLAANITAAHTAPGGAAQS